MRRGTSRKNQRGFTLIEAMISAVLLGVGVLAAIQLFTSSAEGTTWTRDRASATTIAMQRLEFLGTQGITGLPACDGVAGCKASEIALAAPVTCTQQVAEMASDPTITDPNGKYRVDTVIVDHPDAARQVGARLVTVSVCWQDKDLSVHQAQLERLFIPDV